MWRTDWAPMGIMDTDENISRQTAAGAFSAPAPASKRKRAGKKRRGRDGTRGDGTGRARV